MDGQSERCAHCGTPSTDGGRYCMNCGAELGTEPTNPRVLPSPTDTAERVYDAPAPTYLTADPPAAPVPTYAPGGPTHLAPAGPRGVGPGVWAGIVAAMLVVLALGGFLLFRGGDDGGTAGSTPIVPKQDSTASSPDASSDSPGASGSSGSPDSSGSPSSSGQVTGPPTNVAGLAQASAPAHAPAGVDFSGRPVTFVAANMVDGRNDTCWRTAGAATGMVLTFRLDQPTRLTRVGLVNGYSKIAYSHGHPFDWYKGNRRVLSAEWILDNGSSVTQSFGADRGMQQMAIKPVTTSTVRLRIVSVSPPGKGRAARNDTAISEVLLLGRTG